MSKVRSLNKYIAIANYKCKCMLASEHKSVAMTLCSDVEVVQQAYF